MIKNNEIATEVASGNVADATIENVNAAENAASTNQIQKGVKKEITVPTPRVAIINGEERKILVAHPKFGMEQPKDNNNLCDKIDPSKMLSCIYHFTLPSIFWDEGYDLYDENNNMIEKNTPDVLVHVQTAENYWRVGLEKVLERVEILSFSTVKEYAQTVGCTNLYSRGMSDTEKVGVAASATGNKAYQIVFEFAKENKLNLTAARLYLDVSMDKAQILEMSIGAVPESAPRCKRTKIQATELLKQALKTFGQDARKRYVIRPINSLSHKKDYSRELLIRALKSIPVSEASEIRAAKPEDREAFVTDMLTTYLRKNSPNEVKKQEDQKEAA